MSRQTLKTAAAYLTIYIVWGSTYFFIKMAVASFPPSYVLGLRFSIGGLLLLGLAVGSGKVRRRPSLPEILSSMLLGTLLLIGANGLVTIAERRVDSTAMFLKTGRAQTRDLLESQGALLEAQNELTDALVAHTIAKLNFFRDIGVLQVRPDGMWDG